MPAKLERCVSEVKAKGGAVNPWAVCKASTGLAEDEGKAPKRYRLRGVEVFAGGTHRGKDYSADDLADMVENFRRFSTGPEARLRVPAVIGHEEDQSYLRRSDLPAAGWPARLYVEGGKLKADIEGVHPKVARLLAGKAYRTTSAEVYDEPPAGIPGKGRMLRRIAFLGGEIPEVKGLDEIPTPEPYAERLGIPAHLEFRESVELPDGVFAVFAEVRPMTREQMIEHLAGMGFDAGKLESADDGLLGEIIRVYESHESAGADEGEKGEEPAEVLDHEEPAGEDTPVHVDVGSHNTGDDEGGREDEEEMQEASSMPGQSQAGADRTGADTMPGQPGGRMREGHMGSMSRPKKVSVTHTFSERFAAERAQMRREVDAEMARLRRYSELLESERKKLSVDAALESRLKAGKVTRRELDAGPDGNRPTLRDRLLRADASTVLYRFSEGGRRYALTEFDAILKELDDRPALFAERMRVQGADGAKVAEDAEVAQVEQAYEMFAEEYRRQKLSREDLIDGFKRQRRHTPGLTAAGWLNNAK